MLGGSLEESEGLVGLEHLHGRDVSCTMWSARHRQAVVGKELPTLDDLAEDAVGGHLERGHVRYVPGQEAP